jgi:uncharacterized protein involved in exopolysaccharide biosynthesis
MKDDTLELCSRGRGQLPRNSRLATIDFTSTDPAMSARIANAWAEEFIQANLQRRYDSSAYARDFISGQLAEAKSKLEQSERDLNAYARQAGLIRAREATPGADDDSSNASGSSVTTASLLQLNMAANQAQAARIALEERWNMVSRGSALMLPKCYRTARSRSCSDRAKVTADLQRERTKHLEDHPLVQQLKAQLAAIDSQINAVAQNIRFSIKQQYDAAKAETRCGSRCSNSRGLAGRTGSFGAVQPAGPRSRYQSFAL